MPGTSSTDYAWSGFISADDLPRSLAPPEGFIVSANNRVSPANYPLLITHDWASGSNGYRAKRISQLISDKISTSTKVSPDDMRTFQLDTVSELARDLRPLLQTLPQNELTANGLKWKQKLVDWDLAMVCFRLLPFGLPTHSCACPLLTKLRIPSGRWVFASSYVLSLD